MEVSLCEGTHDGVLPVAGGEVGNGDVIEKPCMSIRPETGKNLNTPSGNFTSAVTGEQITASESEKS